MDKFKFSFKGNDKSFSEKREEDYEFMEELTEETNDDLVKKGYTFDEEDIGELNCDKSDEPEEDEFSDDTCMDDEDDSDEEDEDTEEDGEEEWGDEEPQEDNKDFPPEPIKRPRGRPKLTEEEKTGRKGGQPGNQNASLANRQNRTLEKAISPYLEDIKNPVRKRKYASYLSKVRNKELSLDETEALLHMMIAEQQRRPAKSRDNKLVLDAAGQLRQLTETKRKQEETTLSIMRDTKIMDIFSQWAKIIANHITDPILLKALVSELRVVMNSNIDVKNINRTIDNNIKQLNSNNDQRI